MTLVRELAPRPSEVIAAGAIYDKPESNGTVNRVLQAYALVYVLEGDGVYSDAFMPPTPVVAGDVITLFPGARHSYHPNANTWSEIWLMFRGGIFRQLEEEGLLDRYRPLSSPGLQPELVEAFEAIRRDARAGDTLFSATIAARTHVLLIELARAAQAQRPRSDMITLACARLGEDLSRPLDMKRIARSFDLSAERFRKVFASEVGMPPARFRQTKRIERARQLLQTGKQPMSAIALELGYCDEYFFSRQFTAVTGISPARYRREFSATRPDIDSGGVLNPEPKRPRR